MESRKPLGNATTSYLEQLDSQAMAEECALAEDMMPASKAIDFDEEAKPGCLNPHS